MIKEFSINNKKDYQKFLNRVFFYKYYKFTEFKIKNNIKSKDLDDIIEALNIKKRKKRLEYVYDKVAAGLDKYYSKDLCDFKNDQCFVQRKRKDNAKFGCCNACKRVKSKIGCTTSNVSCKLVFCPPLLKKIKKIGLRDIPITKTLSIFQIFILKFNCFSSREQIIKDMNYGLIYWYLRSIRKGILSTFHQKI